VFSSSVFCCLFPGDLPTTAGVWERRCFADSFASFFSPLRFLAIWRAWSSTFCSAFFETSFSGEFCLVESGSFKREWKSGGLRILTSSYRSCAHGKPCFLFLFSISLHLLNECIRLVVYASLSERLFVRQRDLAFFSDFLFFEGLAGPFRPMSREGASYYPFFPELILSGSRPLHGSY